MADSLYFNCGELKPGIRLVRPPDPPSPPIVIPNSVDPVDPPFIPDRSLPDVVDPRSPTDPGTPGGGRPGGPSTGGPSTGGPSTGGPSRGGPTTGGDAIPSTGGGPTTGGTRGPTTGPRGPLIPSTGGPTQSAYRCSVTRTIYCPEDLSLPVASRRIREIERSCVACSVDPTTLTFPPQCTTLEICNESCAGESYNCAPRGPITGPRTPVITSTGEQGQTSTGSTSTGTSVAYAGRRWSCRTYRIVYCSDGSTISHTEQACFECSPRSDGSFDASCTATSEQACLQECPTRILVNECPTVSQSSTAVFGIPPTTGQQEPNNQTTTIPIVTIKPNGSLTTNNQVTLETGLTVIAPSYAGTAERQNETLDVDLENIESNSQAKRAYNTPVIPKKHSSLYDEKFNFFQTEPTEITTLVKNNKHLNIFKDIVAEEVAYALDRQTNDMPWSEENIFNLTTQKILISLKENLNLAISNIHYLGNQEVKTETILKGIKRLLLTGKIDEFDSDYWIDLSRYQSDDTIVKFKNTYNDIVSERVGLGVISEDAIPADSSKHSEATKEYVKRQKRLNTDVEANFTLQTINNEDLRFDLADAGIPLIEIDQNNISVRIGDGDGYYIVIQNQNEDLPLILDTKVAITYFTAPDVRYNALTLFKEEPSLLLTVESTSSHEFKQSYSMSNTPEVMFFGVDLETIQTLNSENPLIDRTKATFRLITDQSEIDYYTTNYGLTITRANVNYDDPFLYYAKDSSSFTLTQSDVTFRSFDRNRTVVGENILSRNIPFGFILTPGCGSNHNPFAGFSKIDKFENDKVTRSLSMIPDIKVTKFQKSNQSLKFEKYYLTYGITSIGLIEEPSFEGGLLSFNPNSESFNNRFYKNGFKSSVTNNGQFGYSVLTNKIQQLASMYDFDDLTWWDIIRRLNYSDLNKFIYDNNFELTKSTINGLFGPKIKRVLARLDPTDTYLTDVITETVATDKVILTERDR